MISLLTHTAKKWSFPLRISSINGTKSAGSCVFSHIYWRNSWWKSLFFVNTNSIFEELKILGVNIFAEQFFIS